jgi:hypothetical protein
MTNAVNAITKKAQKDGKDLDKWVADTQESARTDV